MTFTLSPIKAIELAAAKIPGSVSLAQGIPSFQTPDVIREAVIEQIRLGKCDRYSLTLGLQELREAIALDLQREELSYNPDREIIVTAGAAEGIAAATLAVASPGDEVLIPTPSYVSYQSAVRLAQAVPRFIPLQEDDGFSFDIGSLERAITRRTRAIICCHPNNPTGTIYSRENLEALVALCHRHNLVLISDEVYKDFIYDDQVTFVSPAALPGARERVVRVFSFSKAFAMTGWRVGFIHGPEAILSSAVRYHDAMVTCAPVVSQYGAIAALQYGAPFREQFRQEFLFRRGLLVASLERLTSVLDFQLPRSSYFVFPRLKQRVSRWDNSTALAYDILEKQRVAVVPGVAFGPSGEGHLRISFGRSREDIAEGMARLEAYFTEVNPKRRNTPVATVPQRSIPLPAQLLGAIAHLKMHRSRPVIVGIVGALGKTTIKRALRQHLATDLPVRTSHLSYNTVTGLPLSLLGIESPLPLENTRWKRWLAIAGQIVRSFLRWSSRKEVWILEYGFSSVREAQFLLSIARPDYLVLTGIEGEETFDAQRFTEALEYVIGTVPPDRVFLPPGANQALNTTSGGTEVCFVEDSTLGRHESFGRAVAPLLSARIHGGRRR